MDDLATMENRKRQPASMAHLNGISALAVLPDGDLLIADQANANIQRLGMPRPKFDAEQQIYTVENPQTNEQYEFNGRGMHLRTKALADGVTLQEMEYARDGRLLTIREGGGGEGAARELLEAKATEKKEMDGDEDGDILIAKISCRALANHPISLQYDADQMLHSIRYGDRSAFFGYELSSGRARMARFQFGAEAKEWELLEGPTTQLAVNGQWATRVNVRTGQTEDGQQRETELAQLLLEAPNGGEISLRQSDGKTVFERRTFNSSSSFPSLNWHFDRLPDDEPWKNAAETVPTE